MSVARDRIAASKVEAGDPVVLSFPGSVSQGAALVEVDGALEGMVRLGLVQAYLGPLVVCLRNGFTPPPVADKTAKPAVFGRRLQAAVSGPRKLNRKIIQGTHH